MTARAQVAGREGTDGALLGELDALAPQTLPFATSHEIRAFLLPRPAGNQPRL